MTEQVAGENAPRPMNGRSEGEIIARSGLAVVMGPATYWLRPLTMDGADKWEGRIRDVLASMFGQLGTATGGIDSVLGLYRGTVDAGLDALYAYEELGEFKALPDRAKLRATASRDDLDEAIRKLVKHEFPLLKGMDFIGTWVPAEVREIVTRSLIRMLPEGPPPGPSSSSSSEITPGPGTPPRNRAQRRSGKS